MGSKLSSPPVRLVRSAALFLSTTVALCLPSTAFASNNRHEAHAHRTTGLSLYEAGEFERAQGEFERAYELRPTPDVLFAWAQSARLVGNCSTAISLYQRFIATDPPARQVDAANQHVARCRQTLATERSLAGQVPTQSATECSDRSTARVSTRETSTAGAPVDRPRRFARDALTTTLAGAGLIGLAGGVALFASAQSHSRQASELNSYAAFDAAQTRTQRHRTAAAVVGGTGLALGLTAVVRYIIVRSR
ncbi:MAG: tetratricopeptide repeat protein [Myxococcales bacterium FL481]|nr:MAG: tetratricopeptide repeat protein [Myxococcales bacterium FL481]